jgi:hypothetical protein
MRVSRALVSLILASGGLAQKIRDIVGHYLTLYASLDSWRYAVHNDVERVTALRLQGGPAFSHPLRRSGTSC